MPTSKLLLNSIISTNGARFMSVDIKKISQAGLLANKLLTMRLDEFGYYPCRFSPGFGGTHGGLSHFPWSSMINFNMENHHVHTTPHKHNPIQYGKKVQEVFEDKSPLLSKQQIKEVQHIVCTLLYYL